MRDRMQDTDLDEMAAMAGKHCVAPKWLQYDDDFSTARLDSKRLIEHEAFLNEAHGAFESVLLTAAQATDIMTKLWEAKKEDWKDKLNIDTAAADWIATMSSRLRAMTKDVVESAGRKTPPQWVLTHFPAAVAKEFARRSKSKTACGQAWWDDEFKNAYRDGIGGNGKKNYAVEMITPDTEDDYMRCKFEDGVIMELADITGKEYKAKQDCAKPASRVVWEGKLGDGTRLQLKKLKDGKAILYEGIGKKEVALCQAVLTTLGEGNEAAVIDLLKQLAEEYALGRIEKLLIKAEKDKRIKAKKPPARKTEKKETVADTEAPAAAAPAVGHKRKVTATAPAATTDPAAAPAGGRKRIARSLPPIPSSSELHPSDSD